MFNLTYKVVNNGYEIYNNGNLWITQYEPYIPNRSISYEDNAKEQIKEIEDQQALIDTDKKIKELEKENADLAYLVMMGGLD